jgi:hypothetical protein
MIINGKDRHFELTVQAHMEISKMCPDENFSKIDKLFAKSSVDGDNTLIQIALIMNRAYEDHECHKHPGRVPDYLVEDDFAFMLFPEFNELERVITKTMAAGSSIEVEVEPPKPGKKNETKARKSD